MKIERGAAIPMKYAYLHNTFFVPGFGTIKNKFELHPQDQAGLTAKYISLLANGMVNICITNGTTKKDVSFLVPATNFQVLVPAVMEVE